MTHTPHELIQEFPDAAEALHRLKMENGYFQKLSGHYHTINREIHRIETGIEASSDVRSEDLKKQRLSLLDEIGGLLSATAK